jgi:hypothetical protein
MKELIEMWSLLSRPAHRPGAAQRRSQLGCVRLESRDCPAAPLINSMSVTRLQGAEVRISGQVTDELAGQCEIQISGAATGHLKVGSDGSFDGMLTTNGFGQITARAFDPSGSISLAAEIDFQRTSQIDSALIDISDDSNEQPLPVIQHGASRAPAEALINNAPLILNFAAQNQSGMWALSGFVLDEYSPGLTVTLHSNAISTINNRTVTVGSNGWFSTAFSLPAGSSGGLVSATCVDWFGLQSNQPFVYVG